MRAYDFDLKMKLHSYHFLKTKQDQKKNPKKINENWEKRCDFKTDYGRYAVNVVHTFYKDFYWQGSWSWHHIKIYNQSTGADPFPYSYFTQKTTGSLWLSGLDSAVVSNGANPQTVQLKPTDGFFCQEKNKHAKLASLLSLRCCSSVERALVAQWDTGSPMCCIPSPQKTENSLWKQGFTHRAPEVRLADVVDPELSIRCTGKFGMKPEQPGWERGKNGELPAGPSTGSPSRQATSTRRKHSSFKSF